jgi:predicted amidohydrolase
MIIDPWGQVLADLPDGPGFISAQVDLDYLSQVRRELPCLTHRRLS